MCYQTTCSKCGKPTWAGCGRHVDSALDGVPLEQRCRCKVSQWVRVVVPGVAASTLHSRRTTVDRPPAAAARSRQAATQAEQDSKSGGSGGSGCVNQ